MSSPIPLNYQIAEAQVAQSIESTSPSLYFGDGSSAPYRVIARSSPGSTTVKFKKVGKQTLILRQAEQFPGPTTLDWHGGGGSFGDRYTYAESPRHRYLIEPPGGERRPQNLPPDKILLHTKPAGPHSDYDTWRFHSAHDSMDSAMAAAERREQQPLEGPGVDQHAILRHMGL